MWQSLEQHPSNRSPCARDQFSVPCIFISRLHEFSTGLVLFQAFCDDDDDDDDFKTEFSRIG
jgi:hypothetical protein